MSDRLLVVGSAGLVGSKVATLAPRFGFEPYLTVHEDPSSLPRTFVLDIRDSNATESLVKQIRPRVILNAAALTNVDFCETHPKEAHDVNAVGARNLVEAANSVNARFVQVSTDSVFDGETGHYVETDTPNPINQYSLTKLEAEELVSTLPSHVVARTSVVYGWHRKSTERNESAKALNFAMFVLDRLNQGLPLMAVTDQYSSPTLADELAEALLRFARSDLNGVFHTAGKTCTDRYNFAIKLATAFNLPTNLIRPVLSKDFKQTAPRPKNSCLKVGKAEKTLGMSFSSIEVGVEKMKVSEMEFRAP